jgi:hypothetical protein
MAARAAAKLEGTEARDTSVTSDTPRRPERRLRGLISAYAVLPPIRHAVEHGGVEALDVQVIAAVLYVSPCAELALL